MILYEHWSFDGRQLMLTPGDYPRFEAPLIDFNTWDNAISSFRVFDGVTVTFYEHPDFQGDSISFNGATQPEVDLSDWNDRVSSIRICEIGLQRCHVPYSSTRMIRLE